MTMYNHSESCGVCHESLCKCCKKRKPEESTEQWLTRLGFQPLTEEQKRINLDNNLDWFLR